MNHKISNNTNLKLLQQVCLKQNIPFVSYRLPLHDETITLVQHQSLPKKLESLQNLEEKTGFVVAPFFETKDNGTYFLEPACVCFSNEIEDGYIKELSDNNDFLLLKKTSNTKIQTTTSTDFIENVNLALKTFKKNEFDKVVLSKVRVERQNDNFSAPKFFLKLCETYPHAFVYLVQLPEVGCWMGATPEPLLEIENDYARTVSLAGTQIVKNNCDLKSYQWNPKEIEEQGIVSDFIEQTLRSVNIKNLTKVGPVNYQAANLIHLKTNFEFPQTELNNKMGDFIQALHPTPSVGGLPQNKANEFILVNEKHDRRYYTGFLGTININKKSNLFVNLRCLQLFDKQIVLYSGAGITSSSIAEKEWEETENKMKTLLNVIEKP